MNALKSLNLQAIDVALKLHSQEVQLRRGGASSGDLRPTASWAPLWEAGCRRRSHRPCPSGVGAWLDVTAAVDGCVSGSGLADRFLNQQDDFAGTIHDRKGYCDMWLRGRSYNRLQSVVGVSGIGCDCREEHR